MTRKLLFAAFLLTLALTFVALHHQLTNAAPNMAPPPQQAPPLEQYAARLAPAAAPGDPVWQVVAGGGGKSIWLSDVSMASPDEGWAVGSTGPSSYGVIMHYTNTTWSRVDAPDVPTSTYWLNAVEMISPTEGWAVGGWACSFGVCNWGLLHYTTATGWQTQTLPAKPDGQPWNGGLTDIDIKGTVGWIVSDEKYYLQFDGTSWTPITAPQTYRNYGISILDANEAWAVGYSVSGTLQHYISGIWSLVTPTLSISGTSPSVRLEAVHMLDATEGWAVGSVRTGSSPDYSYQCFLLHYEGSNWSQVSCPADTSSARLYSVQMRSANDVWAVGRDGVILHYNGSSWTRAAAPPGVYHLSSVKLIGTDDGWAVGSNGTILRLVNGNWTMVRGSALPVSVGPLDTVSAREAWFGGNTGQLYQWKNGSITTYTSPVTAPIALLDMVSPTVGWATTDRPYSIIQYSNGMWITETSVSMLAISMVGPDEGWFAPVAAGGGLSHYQSGVWQWYSVPAAGEWNLVNSISMLDANHGWAVGYNGTSSTGRGTWKAFTYTNETWNTVVPTLTVTADQRGNLKVIGISPNEAWVAGWTMACTTEDCPVTPHLYHFSSGTWITVPVSNWLVFFDISKVSATEWWAAGKLKTMEHAFLHYKDGTYTVVSSAGEDVLGISMLPDGSGFARGVGSSLQFVLPVTTTVDPGSSTMLIYTDTTNLTTTVSVPAGAVTSTITLVYTPLYTASAPGGFSFAGHVFDLDAYQDNTLLPGFVFSQPVTITIHYSDADVAGLDENSLVLRYWTGSAWASDGISIIERNPAQNYVVFTITHLSEFALFGMVGPSQVAGVSLTADQSGIVYPSQSIVYQHILTNTGTGTDGFTVTASIDRPNWSAVVIPSVVGPLNSGIASGVVMTVTAPGGITTTVMATAHITATSKFDAGVSAVVTDMTTATPYQVYLPIVIR